MPIYQHLSRSKSTMVIGKIVDSQLGTAITGVSVEAKMIGYQCGPKILVAKENGIFQMEFAHLRNNYPYQVELKLTTSDNSHKLISRNVIIGGVLRAPHIYIEIPMSSITKPQPLITYQTYVIDS